VGVYVRSGCEEHSDHLHLLALGGVVKRGLAEIIKEVWDRLRFAATR
jgi:hypothetical protein